MYNWITLLYIWNYHNIVNQLYCNKNLKRTSVFAAEKPISTQRIFTEYILDFLKVFKSKVCLLAFLFTLSILSVSHVVGSTLDDLNRSTGDVLLSRHHIHIVHSFSNSINLSGSHSLCFEQTDSHPRSKPVWRFCNVFTWLGWTTFPRILFSVYFYLLWPHGRFLEDLEGRKEAAAILYLMHIFLDLLTQLLGWNSTGFATAQTFAGFFYSVSDCWAVCVCVCVHLS